MRYAGSTDLSFATWLCGGGAYVVPCSRVAKVQSASTSMVGILSVKYFYINELVCSFVSCNDFPKSIATWYFIWCLILFLKTAAR